MRWIVCPKCNGNGGYPGEDGFFKKCDLCECGKIPAVLNGRDPDALEELGAAVDEAEVGPTYRGGYVSLKKESWTRIKAALKKFRGEL